MSFHRALAVTAVTAITASTALTLAATQAAHAEPPRADALDAKSAAPEAILGEWWTEKKDGKVRFEKLKDGTYWGILSWSSANPPRKDEKNPDPKLRDRPLVGIVLIWNLKFQDGEFVDGKVYNPNEGKTYGMKIKVNGDGTLTIRGYAGIALFGQSQTWTRVK